MLGLALEATALEVIYQASFLGKDRSHRLDAINTIRQKEIVLGKYTFPILVAS